LFQKQNGKCALSGVEISLLKKSGVSTASLDRVDSSKGYIKGNVQWVHKDVNFMKYNFDESYFLDMCKKVVVNKGL